MPRLGMSFYRQIIRFSEEPEDVELANAFFGTLSTRIEHMLGQL